MNKMNKQVTFTAANRVELKEHSAETMMNQEGLVIQTEKSIISAGTELACLSGSESWAPFPFVPGYGSVGVVVKEDPQYPDLKEGDRVFTYGRHEAYSVANTVVRKLPEGMDASQAVFARIAAVSISALRVSDVELGDKVAVIGMGLVGNLAAQLFTLAGCDVIGIDTAATRLEIAKQCGIAHPLTASAENADQIKELTEGRMCRAVVDATGIPAVAAKAPLLAGKDGEFILLGSPRGEYQTNLTEFLNYSHLAPFGCITIKGAHEYRFPQSIDTDQRYKHSFESNVAVILERIADQRIKTKELLSHTVKPAQCAEIYKGLKENGGDYMGVIYDWC